MKLLLAMVPAAAGEPALAGLLAAGHRVISLAGAAGSAMAPVATLLVQLDENQLPDAAELLRAATEGVAGPRPAAFVLDLDAWSEL